MNEEFFPFPNPGPLWENDGKIDKIGRFRYNDDRRVETRMKDNRKFWGVALLIIGILFLMDRLGVFDVRWFFRGGGHCSLIIPALYTMFKNGIQTGTSSYWESESIFFSRNGGSTWAGS